MAGHEPWRSYGYDEPVIKGFLRKYPNASLFVHTVDLLPDGSLENEHTFTEYHALDDFTKLQLDAEEVAMRILLVRELSAEGLQILSHNLGMHSAFWGWVASEQASDGFWLNTHNDGKILSFDMPLFEFYGSRVPPPARVVREGRLKQLSSRHRLFGAGLTADTVYEAYINRRVSGYLIPTGTGGPYTFVFLSEDCVKASSFQMFETEKSEPLSIEWVLQDLKATHVERRLKYTKEPLGLILSIITRALRTWHVLTVHMQRDLENIDNTLPEGLPQHLPEHNLYDIGNYLHRDIVQTLFRFTQQLGKYEGYLRYLCNGTRDHFRPNIFNPDVGNLNNNIVDLRRRLDASKERGNMSLTLINNYIALQQARLASEQARISTLMAEIQLRDSQSSNRLSVVATVFLPLSFATSWLSTNESTPIWVFVPVAAISIIVTACILLILRWNRPAQLQADSKIAGFVKTLIGRKPRKSAVEEKRREEDEDEDEGDSGVSRRDTKDEEAMVRTV